MPLHITLEKLRGFVMLPAGQVLLCSSVLPTFENWNFWKKHDDCKQKQNFLLQELHEKLSQNLFPYHLRFLVIKEEPRSPPSDCIVCTHSNDGFPNQFPLSALFSVIPCSDVIQHCLIEIFITFKPPCFITTHSISEIMPIWNCFIKVWKNDSDEKSCKPWLRSTTKTIQNPLIPESFDLRWWKVFEVLFENVLSCFWVVFHTNELCSKQVFRYFNDEIVFWCWLLWNTTNEKLEICSESSNICCLSYIQRIFDLPCWFVHKSSSVIDHLSVVLINHDELNSVIWCQIDSHSWWICHCCNYVFSKSLLDWCELCAGHVFMKLWVIILEFRSEERVHQQVWVQFWFLR